MATNDLKSLIRKMTGLEKQIDQVIRVTISQYANLIFNEAMAKLGVPSLVASYDLRFEDNGYRVYITTDSNIAAYIEFGTGSGNFAKTVARYSPEEAALVEQEAIKFYVSGDGTMPARPYLFDTFFKYRGEIAGEIDKRIQKILDRV